MSTIIQLSAFCLLLESLFQLIVDWSIRKKAVSAKALAKLCADACKTCADACKAHRRHWRKGHHLECKACYEACVKCEEACLALVNVGTDVQ